MQMLTDEKYKILRCWETTGFPNTMHKLHHKNRCLKVHGKTRELVTYLYSLFFIIGPVVLFVTCYHNLLHT